MKKISKGMFVVVFDFLMRPQTALRASANKNAVNNLISDPQVKGNYTLCMLDEARKIASFDQHPNMGAKYTYRTTSIPTSWHGFGSFPKPIRIPIKIFASTKVAWC